MYEAARWALKIINQDTGKISGNTVTDSYVPGIKLGTYPFPIFIFLTLKTSNLPNDILRTTEWLATNASIFEQPELQFGFQFW